MAYQSWWRLDYSINLRGNSCQAIHSKKQSHNNKDKGIQERKILKIAKGTDDLMSTCDEAFDSLCAFKHVLLQATKDGIF